MLLRDPVGATLLSHAPITYIHTYTGTGLGILLSSALGSSWAALAPICASLSFVHITCNYLSLRHVCLNTINAEVCMSIHRHIDSTLRLIVMMIMSLSFLVPTYIHTALRTNHGSLHINWPYSSPCRNFIRGTIHVPIKR